MLEQVRIRAADQSGRFAVAVAITFAVLAPGKDALAQEVLLVTNNVNVTPADQALYSVIEGLGMTPVVVMDSQSSAADAEGKALILISESTSSSNTTNKFIDVPVPYISLEGFVQDDMNYTGDTQDTDYGFIGDGGTTINIVGDHPLLGGLPPGPVQIYEESGTMQWGIPVASATVLATIPDNDAQAVLYIFEEGAEMDQGTVAPARRAFFTPHSSATEMMTESGLFLLANLILWAIDSDEDYIPISAGITAVFSASPSAGFVPLTVEFDGSGSASPGTITSYEWDFGDGTTDSGATVSHEFTEVGNFTVTLTVTDDQGGTAMISRTISVGEPVSFEPHFMIPHTVSAPAIDGEMEALWSTAVALPLENTSNGADPTDADDLSATAQVLYDAENLYVLFVVRDADLHNDSASSWQDDAVDLYLDGGLEKCFNCYDANDGQFEFSYGSTDVTGGAAGGPLGAGVTHAWADIEGGYQIEAVVPWANFGLNPVAGTVVGMEFMVNDDDDGGDTRETKIAWFSTEDNTYQYAHLMGNAELGAGPVAVEEPDGLPGRFAIESIYPNPFNPSTTAVVSVREGGEYEVSVYNTLGAKVYRKTMRVAAPGQIQVPLDFEGRASGVYFISVINRVSGIRTSAQATLLR